MHVDVDNNNYSCRQDLEKKVNRSDNSPPQQEEYYVYRRYSR